MGMMVKLYCVKFEYGGHKDNVMVPAATGESAIKKFKKDYPSNNIEFISCEQIDIVGDYDVILYKR